MPIGLTVNVIKPANATSKAKLPVVVVSYTSSTVSDDTQPFSQWIYGGAFRDGSTAG